MLYSMIFKSLGPILSGPDDLSDLNQRLHELFQL